MTVARLFVLAGDPVAHSKSPAMHAAAFRALGLPHSYQALPVDAAAFRSLVLALRRGQIFGMNVTVPHKRIAFALADVHDPIATRSGAANTLARDDDGRVLAFNTDVPALEAELESLSPRARGAEHALVLGSGGAARAAVIALEQLGVARITVRARDVVGATALTALAPNVIVEALSPSPDVDATLGLVIQATSAGMTGADAGDEIARAVAWDVVPTHAVAYDVVYAPALTPFVIAARRRGLRAESGIGMLVRQGALAFERWHGIAAPLAEMRAAALAEPARTGPAGV